MLIVTQHNKGDTVSFKLQSGEEIVARIDDVTETGYRLHKPLTLMNTGQGIGLGQFMMTADPLSDIHMPKSSVVCTSKTHTEMAKKYIEATTGLKT